MATVVWTAIFLLLCVELFILLLLCAPLPFRLQSGIAKFLVDTKLARKMRTAMWYLTLAVTLGVVEALQTIYKLEAPVEKAEDPMMGHNLVSVTIHEYKIRKFRAHRNLYLAGFVLALLFALNRIVHLLSNEAMLKREIHRLVAEADAKESDKTK
mmetsp:Transcript_18070/g.37506  ORF Transcript_18070/g.37506 Transcript_18070/m.37506 type:complete len:155 (-) Transcript_18070:1386-1850(-)